MNMKPNLKKGTKQHRIHRIPIEAIGSRIEIIGGSIYPKEESWKTPCPHCKKWLKIRLTFDEQASEFQVTIEEEVETKLEKG